MKRMSSAFREESYEHVLMCLICRSLFDDYDHQPKFLPCHHTFCKDCLREYIHQNGDEIECPSCRKVTTIPAAGVTALQTNFYVKYIQGLVQGPYGSDGSATECARHPGCVPTYYCKKCQIPICTNCCKAQALDDNVKSQASCAQHDKVSLNQITEESHQKLDTSFAKANALIEKKKVESEALLRALCQEKDQALLKIESTFEQHVHTLSRRSTLLKNKVIDIYNEHVGKLEADLEEISTAMTCVVSLKEYHEGNINKAQFQETDRGIAELDEVFSNINEKVKPAENHIVFEDKHGVDKFKVCVKDLGRVKTNRPIIPRTEPEGGSETSHGNMSPQVDTPSQTSDSECSPVHTLADFNSSRAYATSMYIPAEQKLCTELSCDKMISSMHELMHHAFAKCDHTGHSTSKLKNHTCPSQLVIDDSGEKVDKNANNNSNIDTFDANLNIDESQQVVRPKTLDTCKKSKKPTAVHKSKHLAVHDRYHGDKTNAILNRIHGDSHSDQVLTLPDIEAVKKADRAYHQLVYTSYDEEELLKELKANRIHLNDPNISFMTRMNESDSWMTASSIEDNMVLSAGDDHLQQSTL